MMMMVPGLNDADGCPLGYDDGGVVQSSGLVQIIKSICSPIGREKSVSTTIISKTPAVVFPPPLLH